MTKIREKQAKSNKVMREGTPDQAAGKICLEKESYFMIFPVGKKYFY